MNGQIWLIAALAGAVVMGQAPGTATITGTVVDDTGAGVGEAVVTAQRTEPPFAMARARALANGNFTLSGLGAGPYRLCATVRGRGLLDPCQWTERAPGTVSLAAGQRLAGQRVAMSKGTTLRVRVTDAGKLLETADAGARGHLLIGVWSAEGIFYPMILTGKDAAGSDYEAPIPVDHPVRLTVNGTRVRVRVGGAGAEAAAAGSQRLVVAKGAAAPAVVPVIVEAAGAN